KSIVHAANQGEPAAFAFGSDESYLHRMLQYQPALKAIAGCHGVVLLAYTGKVLWLLHQGKGNDVTARVTSVSHNQHRDPSSAESYAPIPPPQPLGTPHVVYCGFLPWL